MCCTSKHSYEGYGGSEGYEKSTSKTYFKNVLKDGFIDPQYLKFQIKRKIIAVTDWLTGSGPKN